MRKFLLLLLAFVLTLQMSWAAAHFCDESTHAAAKLTLATQAEPAADASQDKPINADALADACCSASHACHGLHSVMGPADEFAMPVRASEPITNSPPALFERDARNRIERPQWLAA